MRRVLVAVSLFVLAVNLVGGRASRSLFVPACIYARPARAATASAARPLPPGHGALAAAPRRSGAAFATAGGLNIFGSSPALPVGESVWALVMQTRRDAFLGDGDWRVDDTAAPGCIVHRDGGTIQLGAWACEPQAVLALALDLAAPLIAAQQNVSFAALDRRLVEPLTQALAELGYEPRWRESCGLYQAGEARQPPPRLPADASIEALRDDDAELVDSRWTYRSATSLEARVRPMITAGLGCWGVRQQGRLQAWVLRYRDGALGMLWVEPAARRAGFAFGLLARARQDLEAAGQPCFCYIVDGNTASEHLFRKAGWTRVADADWVGFAPADDG